MGTRGNSGCPSSCPGRGIRERSRHHAPLWPQLPRPACAGHGAIQEWATGARQFELSLTLHRYAENAARHTYMANYLHQADPDGWGQRRFVMFGSAGRAAIPERWDKAELENVVKVDTKPINGIQV